MISNIRILGIVLVLALLRQNIGAPDNCQAAGIEPGSAQAKPGDNSVTLTWIATPSKECVDQFQIQIFIKENQDDLKPMSGQTVDNGQATGVVINNLENGVNYLFVIAAENQFGSGVGEVEATSAKNSEVSPSPEDPVIVNSSPKDPITVNDLPQDPMPQVVGPMPDDPIAVNNNTGDVLLPPPPPQTPPPIPNNLPPPPPPTPSPLPPPPTPTPTPSPLPPFPSPVENVAPPPPFPIAASEAGPKSEETTQNQGGVPGELIFVTTRCAVNKCCVSWRKSMLDVNMVDYYVVAIARNSDGSSLLNQEIDYTAGLKFTDALSDVMEEACVEFDGLNDGQFYAFQVFGVNGNGFGAPSRWSRSRTRSDLLSSSSLLGNDCGCTAGQNNFDTPQNFDLTSFKQAFPGYDGP